MRPQIIVSRQQWRHRLSVQGLKYGGRMEATAGIEGSDPHRVRPLISPMVAPARLTIVLAIALATQFAHLAVRLSYSDWYIIDSNPAEGSESMMLGGIALHGGDLQGPGSDFVGVALQFTFVAFVACWCFTLRSDPARSRGRVRDATTSLVAAAVLAALAPLWMTGKWRDASPLSADARWGRIMGARSVFAIGWLATNFRLMSYVNSWNTNDPSLVGSADPGPVILYSTISVVVLIAAAQVMRTILDIALTNARYDAADTASTQLVR